MQLSHNLHFISSFSLFFSRKFFSSNSDSLLLLFSSYYGFQKLFLTTWRLFHILFCTSMCNLIFYELFFEVKQKILCQICERSKSNEEKEEEEKKARTLTHPSNIIIVIIKKTTIFSLFPHYYISSQQHRTGTKILTNSI